MIKINVIFNNINWKKHLKNPNSYFDKVIFLLNKKNKTYKKNILIFTLLLSGNNEIKKLNKKFRNKNKSTDVLSFPFYEKKQFKNKIKIEKEVYLGDIIINFHKLKNKKNQIDFKKNLNKLWIHGLVHLLGYKHKTEKEFYSMRKIEKNYLKYIS